MAMKLVKPAIVPPLDEDFRPASLANRAFLEEVRASGRGVPLVIGVERGEGLTSVFETEVFEDGAEGAEANLQYVERLVKFLLWQRGGWKVTIAGPESVGEYIKQVYSLQGAQEFDFKFMGRDVYERTFTVEVTDEDHAPEAKERTVPLGRHLEGNRIGFDLGASDRKSAAVIDGKEVFSIEVPWDPRNQSDPQYHYDGIEDSLQRAAEHLPRVDAIGGSAAGIYINNRAMIASLFRGVPKQLFDARIKDIFLNIGKDWGVPLEVANDGDVTALAASMALGVNAVLGIAMGSSEAGGYVSGEGNITGWLNELAFAPVDYQPHAPEDDWSHDIGCGVQYFSQECVVRLAPAAGIKLNKELKPAEKLEVVQELMAKGDERPGPIYETIGVYLGYALAHYADFYDLEHVLILGRVTSGEGGNIILDRAREVLKQEFPELAREIELHTPDEKSRRVGQAIAAASLPEIG